MTVTHFVLIKRAVIRAEEGTEDGGEEDGIGVGLALTGGVVGSRNDPDNGLKVTDDKRQGSIQFNPMWNLSGGKLSRI